MPAVLLISCLRTVCRFQQTKLLSRAETMSRSCMEQRGDDDISASDGVDDTYTLRKHQSPHTLTRTSPPHFTHHGRSVPDSRRGSEPHQACAQAGSCRW